MTNENLPDNPFVTTAQDYPRPIPQADAAVLEQSHGTAQPYEFTSQNVPPPELIRQASAANAGVTTDGKRLSTYGFNLIYINIQLVIPFVNTEMTEAQSFDAKNIIRNVHVLGCCVSQVEVKSDHLLISLKIPPTVTVERIVQTIRQDLQAYWLATYRKPLVFNGPYCADTKGITAQELGDFINKVKNLGV